MRAIRTLLLAAIPAVLVACSAGDGGIVDPGSSPALRDGTGLIGTGNSMPGGSEPDSTDARSGTGLIGTGN